MNVKCLAQGCHWCERQIAISNALDEGLGWGWEKSGVYNNFFYHHLQKFKTTFKKKKKLRYLKPM